MKFEDLKRLELLLPPLSEQRSIATFLDKEAGRIDELIKKKQRQIELLQEKRAAIISHAVTKGLDPNVQMKETGIVWLPQIPSDWKVMKFKQCAFFQEGPGLRNWQFTDDGVRVICVTNITDQGIDFRAYQKFIAANEYKEGYCRFKVSRGDLLLSSSGNSWGKVAEYNSDEISILNTSTIRINETKSSPPLTRSFIKFVLQSHPTREQLGLMMTGACQPNFGPSHLSNVFVPVPSLLAQNKIVGVIDKQTRAIDTLINKIHMSIGLLSEFRQSLISSAVTGKIDVRKEIAHARATH
jgi:type I restriction enzyme S subunit